ncbi:MAG: beta-propeller fold lactonase family protein, partial [Burkholderiales bacterium]
NISCATNTFTIGGTVTGLAGGQQVTLFNNGGDAKIVTADGAYTFNTPVNFNGSYAVTVNAQPTGQTCSVTTGTGSGVTANVTTANISCATNTFTIGGTVTGLLGGQQVTLFNNGGDAKTITVDGAYTFTAPVNFNGSYAVTVNTQPGTGSCRVTANGSGANVAANVTNVTLTCGLGMAYVANSASATISQFRIGADGGLVAVGTPIATGAGPRKVVADPTGQFAYVANFDGNSISQYKIGADGLLTANGTIATGLSLPYSIGIDSTGAYAYVVNQGSDTISQYTIGATGVLTPMGVPTIATGHLPYLLTMNPAAAYVYVANLGNIFTPGTTVSQYSIGAGGALVAMADVSTGAGSGPIGVAVNPAGTFAYVTDFLTSQVSQYTINGAGSLVATAFTNEGTGNNPYPITISPNGVYAYWSNKGDNTVSQCVFAVSGALDCTAGVVSTVVSAGEMQPQYIATDVFSKYVYVANRDNDTGAGTIAQYTIGAGGALTLIGGAAPTTGVGPFSVTTIR